MECGRKKSEHEVYKTKKKKALINNKSSASTIVPENSKLCSKLSENINLNKSAINKLIIINNLQKTSLKDHSNTGEIEIQKSQNNKKVI